MPAAENPTVAMVEAAYRHHGLAWRYINCEVAPAHLADAVRGARAMGWAGFNCSLPHKVAVIEHLDGLGESASIISVSLDSTTASGDAAATVVRRRKSRRFSGAESTTSASFDTGSWAMGSSAAESIIERADRNQPHRTAYPEMYQRFKIA